MRKFIHEEMKITLPLKENYQNNISVFYNSCTISGVCIADFWSMNEA